ncbi:hypothetical protein [Ancylobacter sp. G4_0304]|uniref:hypothetical protein n=1 Tax=Ancylobacter sp. G4_0304 TaxID=3114289 RepID=UPI0039C747D1
MRGVADGLQQVAGSVRCGEVAPRHRRGELAQQDELAIVIADIHRGGERLGLHDQAELPHQCPLVLRRAIQHLRVGREHRGHQVQVGEAVVDAGAALMRHLCEHRRGRALKNGGRAVVHEGDDADQRQCDGDTEHQGQMGVETSFHHSDAASAGVSCVIVAMAWFEISGETHDFSRFSFRIVSWHPVTAFL